MSDDTPYSNREIDGKFEALHEALADQNKVLEKILEQTTATNGSVKKLQLWEATSKGWAKGFGIAVVCIIALVGIIYTSLINGESKTQNLIECHISNINCK